MKSLIPVLWLCAGLMGCSADSPPEVRSGEPYRVDASRIEGLRGMRVRELFVVIFPKDYSVEEWRAIFEQTNLLSKNKRRLREIEGRDEPQIQEERSAIIGKNAEILLELGMKSLFMMSWTSQDENCSIDKEMRILCDPFNPDNPLNGGLPANTRPLRYVIPNPVQNSSIKTPYLSAFLEKKKSGAGIGFGIELRLKPEASNAQSSWYKGDVVIEEGSVFPSATDGSPVGTYYRYGYSEMTLGL